MATEQRRKVVVIGAGYAGAATAAKLDRTRGIDVTLVTPRNVLVHKIGFLRAVAAGGTW